MIAKYLIDAAIVVVLIYGVIAIVKHVDWKRETSDLLNLFRRDA